MYSQSLTLCRQLLENERLLLAALATLFFFFFCYSTFFLKERRHKKFGFYDLRRIALQLYLACAAATDPSPFARCSALG